MRIQLAIAGFAGIVSSFQFAAAAGAAHATPQSFVSMDDRFNELRDDFNRAQGTVRLLFVVDPICPGCLRGMDDMNRDLLSKTTDSRLRTFVVHVPVIGAQSKDVLPAAKLLENPNVRHYWNPSGEFGRSLSRAVQLQSDKDAVYAWDVWLLYGPDAKWTAADPPQPKLLMHQLRRLAGSKFPKLDSKVFAHEVQNALSTLPAAHTQE